MTTCASRNTIKSSGTSAFGFGARSSIVSDCPLRTSVEASRTRAPSTKTFPPSASARARPHESASFSRKNPSIRASAPTWKEFADLFTIVGLSRRLMTDNQPRKLEKTVPKPLLAVDDSATMRKVLEITFVGEDFNGLTASDRGGLLAKLTENPNAVVIDTTL